MWILSADIGGTKLALAISKQEQPGQLIKQLEVKSPQQSEVLFEAIISNFNQLLVLQGLKLRSQRYLIL